MPTSKTNFYTFLVIQCWHFYYFPSYFWVKFSSFCSSHGNKPFLSHNIVLIYIHLWFFCATILTSRISKTKHSRCLQNCGLVQQTDLLEEINIGCCFMLWVPWLYLLLSLKVCYHVVHKGTPVILVLSKSNWSNEPLEFIVLHLPAVNFMKLWC